MSDLSKPLGGGGRPDAVDWSARPEYLKWNTMFFSIKMKKSIKKNNSIFAIKYTVRRITKLQTSACGMCNFKYYRVKLQLNILDQDSSFMVKLSTEIWFLTTFSLKKKQIILHIVTKYNFISYKTVNLVHFQQYHTQFHSLNQFSVNMQIFNYCSTKLRPYSYVACNKT